MSGTRHVILALTLTAVLFIIAGDSWDARIGGLTPVRAAPKV